MQALKNHIIFTFLDPVSNKGEFIRKESVGGISLLSGFDNSAKQPRWAEVVSVGPDVEHVAVGQVILLPALRWTERIEHDGGKFWKTIESEVVCVRDSTAADAGMQVLNTFVLFTPDQPPETVTQSGLVVVGQLDDNNPTGTVFHVGYKAEVDLTRAKIYYEGGVTFNNTVEVGNGTWPTSFSFIKDEDILAYEAAE